MNERQIIRDIFSDVPECRYLAEFYPTFEELLNLAIDPSDFIFFLAQEMTASETPEEHFRRRLLKFWEAFPAARRGRLLPSPTRN